jgi:hypothetical protein
VGNTPAHDISRQRGTKWKAPPQRGFVATGYPVRRHRRAASFGEWHHTTPDLRRLQLATSAVTDDTRMFTRDLARCAPGTRHAVLRNPDLIFTLLPRQRQHFCTMFFCRGSTVLSSGRKTIV